VSSKKKEYQNVTAVRRGSSNDGVINDTFSHLESWAVLKRNMRHTTKARTQQRLLNPPKVGGGNTVTQRARGR